MTADSDLFSVDSAFVTYYLSNIIIDEKLITDVFLRARVHIIYAYVRTHVYVSSCPVREKGRTGGEGRDSVPTPRRNRKLCA